MEMEMMVEISHEVSDACLCTHAHEPPPTGIIGRVCGGV